MKKLTLIFLLLFLLVNSIVAQTTVYVSPTGTSSGAGTEASPKDISTAINDSNIGPGYTIVLMNGTYNLVDELYLWRKDGTATSPVTIKAQNKHQAILQGNPQYSSNRYAVLSIAGCQHVIVDGVVTMHPANSLDQAYGIRVTPAYAEVTENSEFITIRNCKSFDNGGGGISADGSDHIIFEDNIVYGNCTRNQVNTSGISVYKLKALTSTTDYWGCVIQRNISYNNRCELDFYYNENGTIYSSDKPTDGNGIIIDFLDNDTGAPYGKRVLVENNVCYNNGGKGIQAFNSSNVRITNNTVYHNNWVLNREDNETFEISMIGHTNDDHQGVHSNVVIANPAHKKDYAMGIQGNPGYTYGNYLVGPAVRRYADYTLSEAAFPSDNIVKPIADQNTTVKLIAPGTDPATANFRPQTTSPLVNAYTRDIYYPAEDADKVARPQGQYADLGAYEFVYATGIVVSPSSVTLTTSATQQLSVTFTPSNATHTALTWSSSNTSIATVDASGVVTALAAGTATITVQSANNNQTATCTVTVTASNTCGLITNNGFESGFTDWLNAGKASITTNAHSGSKAAALNKVGGITYANLINVMAGQEINFEVWAKIEKDPKSPLVGIDYLNNANMEIGEDFLQITATSYTRYTLAKVPPTGTVKVRIWTYKGSSKGVLYIDDLCLTTTASARLSAERVLGESQPQIYPNPTSGSLQLSYLDTSSQPLEVAVFDLTGRQVLTRRFLSGAVQTQEGVDLSFLKAGLYLIQLKQGEKSFSQRVIKQ